MDVSNRLAHVLAERLQSSLKPHFDIVAEGELLRVTSSLSDDSITINVDYESRAEMMGKGDSPRSLAAAIVVLALDQVQDFIAIELRAPWPGTTSLPLPYTSVKQDEMIFGFGVPEKPTLEYEPLYWTALGL